MSEIWIEHISVELWQSPNRWATYFSQAQELIGAKLTHFDTADPIRRKVTTLSEAGEYACASKPKHDSRWLFGQFANTGVSFSARHMRQIETRKWYNEFIWHLPMSFISSETDRLRLLGLFEAGNVAFRPFYSFADESGAIMAKPGQKSAGRMPNIERELLGIYWLTYFNSRYVEFLARPIFKICHLLHLMTAAALPSRLANVQARR